MNCLRSIVLGVDFSSCSASALKQAIRIVTWNGAKLHVIHIVERAFHMDLVNIAAGLDPSQIVADAREAWREFIVDIPEASELELQVEIGHPVAAIVRQAREQAADLLVLGAHGMLGHRSGTGTVATACVRKAMTKVLLVREPHAVPFKSVVACIDFSETSFRALKQAVRVATQDGARLHVLHVFYGPGNTLHDRARTGLGTADYGKQYRDSLRHQLEEFSKPLLEEMRDLPHQYEVFTFPNYGTGITDFARQVNADLVVLGTRGRTNLRDILWGSTAERVVRDAPCSVLAVKPAGFEHPLALAKESRSFKPQSDRATPGAQVALTGGREDAADPTAGRGSAPKETPAA